MNAFTNVAQSLLPDDRYSLEALAGHLLERGLPNSESAGDRARSRTPATPFDEDSVLA